MINGGSILTGERTGLIIREMRVQISPAPHLMARWRDGNDRTTAHSVNGCSVAVLDSDTFTRINIVFVVIIV